MPGGNNYDQSKKQEIHNELMGVRRAVEYYMATKRLRDRFTAQKESQVDSFNFMLFLCFIGLGIRLGNFDQSYWQNPWRAGGK
jgi:hypothetical protein